MATHGASHVRDLVSGAAWGPSTARLREILKENHRVLDVHDVHLHRDGQTKTLKSIVKLEVNREVELEHRSLSPPLHRGAEWLEALTDDDDDFMIPPGRRVHAYLDTPESPGSDDAPAVPNHGSSRAVMATKRVQQEQCSEKVQQTATEQATQTQPDMHHTPSRLLDSTSISEMAAALLEQASAAGLLSDEEQSGLREPSGEAHLDAWGSPRPVHSRGTQTRWKMDEERREARGKRDQSIRQLLDREAALQAELQNQKTALESLRRSEQRALRTRDDALRKVKDVEKQLLHAKEELVAVHRDKDACRRRLAQARGSAPGAASPGRGQGPGEAGAVDSVSQALDQHSMRPADPGSGHKCAQGEQGTRGKSWQLLEAERERRLAEQRADKAARELEAERAKSHALEHTVEALQREAARVQRCRASLQQTVSGLELRLQTHLEQCQQVSGVARLASLAETGAGKNKAAKHGSRGHGAAGGRGGGGGGGGG
jgi:hypothetical protein